jgi:PilZ domain
MVVVGNYRTRAELRKNLRQQLNYSARIMTDRQAPQIVCAIADISKYGARLVLESDDELPDTFALILTPNGAAQRHRRVVWRDGPTIGVEFHQDVR